MQDRGRRQDSGGRRLKSGSKVKRGCKIESGGRRQESRSWGEKKKKFSLLDPSSSRLLIMVCPSFLGLGLNNKLYINFRFL
jgi:hypothetical protein